MTTRTPAHGRPLREWYATERARIGHSGAASAAGLAERTALTEAVLLRLWHEIVAPHAAQGCALVAMGGFGRGHLFPFSDIDVLLLYESRDSEAQLRDFIRSFSQEVWDMRLRLSPARRTLAECDRVDANNIEFTLALLDGRYLAGDRGLFVQLHDKLLLRLIVRERQLLVEKLAELSRARHTKFGNTVFQLEPNVKESPGGLRDYNVSCWLALISASERLRAWPDASLLFPEPMRAALAGAVDFLTAVRCFLHERRGRDDNLLSWEMQDEAARRQIGTATTASAEILAEDRAATNTAEWMRAYFRHARSVDRLATQMLEEAQAAHSSLYRQFQSWRSRLSNADFSVVNGLIFLQQPSAIHDPDLLLRTFRFLAHHDLKLSMATERRIQQALPALAAAPPQGAELWRPLAEIFHEPHAADALRAMHHLGLLTLLLPELQAIDALVVRDFYHRFTVDEHSFLAIESLHRLRHGSEPGQRFATLFNEVQRPELLLLALLLHDVGKGVERGDHVQASLAIAAQCLARLDLEPVDRETVLFLIGSHLEMSAALRRDIFDAETVRAFAEKMGTPERLKMLCLMTYADIKAVNPQALTPWKTENVWQLYIAAANYLSRSVDENRFRAAVDSDALAHLRSLAPTGARRKLKDFLEGLPQRYLRAHTAEEILKHVEMASRLGAEPVQLALQRGRYGFSLTLVGRDRPFLFAQLAGVLAAWGMNIVKVDAFSNQAAVVVDTFYFTDPFRTLELNLPEWERFQRSVADVLAGRADLERLLRNRARARHPGAVKVKVATRVDFDDRCSPHSTLLQVIAQDQPGLLYRISSRIAYQKCNIEIALVDTEGQMAIDVFYLTAGGKKLDSSRQARLRKALLEELQNA